MHFSQTFFSVSNFVFDFIILHLNPTFFSKYFWDGQTTINTYSVPTIILLCCRSAWKYGHRNITALEFSRYYCCLNVICDSSRTGVVFACLAVLVTTRCHYLTL
jgi:hypothetical protein